MMSYWVLMLSWHVISCVTVQQLTNSERNTDKWSQQMREYNIAIEQRLDVNDANLSKEINMVERWKNLAVEDEDPEFFDE